MTGDATTLDASDFATLHSLASRLRGTSLGALLAGDPARAVDFALREG